MANVQKREFRVYSDEEKALAKAVFLTENTPWDVQAKLHEMWGHYPAWGAIRKWVQDLDVLPNAAYMAEFAKAVNGRISAMLDEQLELMHRRITTHAQDMEFSSYDLMQETKSFIFLVGGMRPLEFRGGSAQAANIYLGPTTIDARTVQMPFGPREVKEAPNYALPERATPPELLQASVQEPEGGSDRDAATA